MLGTMAVGSAYLGLYYPPLGTTPPAPTPDVGGGFSGGRRRRTKPTDRLAAEAKKAGLYAPDLVAAYIAARQQGYAQQRARQFAKALPMVAASAGVTTRVTTEEGMGGLPWIIILAAWEWLEEWT